MAGADVTEERAGWTMRERAVPAPAPGVAIRSSLAYAAFFVAIGASFPYLPIYFRELGLDLPAIGALIAGAAAVQLAAAPVWGMLTDRFALQRATLPAAALVAALAATGIGVARGPLALAAAVLLLGAGLVGVAALLDARTIQLLGDRLRYGRVRAWGSVSFVVASLGVGAMIDRLGTSALFLVYPAAFVATALICLTLPVTPTERSPGVLHGTAALLRDRAMALFLLGTLIEWMAAIGANTFVSIQLATLGAPAGAIGVAWALSATIQVPIMWWYPRLAARFGTAPLIVLGGAAFAVRAIAYVLFGSVPAMVALTTLEGVGFSLFICGGVAHVAHLAPRRLAATAQGLFASITFGFATILGSALGGILADAVTIPGLFLVCGLAGLVAVGVLIRAVTAARQGRGQQDGDRSVLVETG